jgi:hypothetical protein
MSAKILIGAHSATSYTGSGAGLTNIGRSAIAAGAPNTIIVNDAGGLLSEVLYLDSARGGTGFDASAADGIARVTAGVWSFGPISLGDLGGSTPNSAVVTDGSGNLSTELQLAPSRGGTGLNTSSSTGVAKVSAGTWSVSAITNADVAVGASISRSKLASGVPNQIVLNDGTGVMTSAATLGTALGGTGADFSSTGVGPFIMTNSSGVFSTTLTYGTAATPNSLVQRDGAGNISLGAVITTSITTDVLTAPGDLVVNPVGDLVLEETTVIQTAGTLPGGQLVTSVNNVQTVGAVTADIVTIATNTGLNGTSYTLTGLITGGAAVGDGLLFSFFARAKNILGVVTAFSPVMVAQSTDAALNTASISVIASGLNVVVRVNGVAGKTINWCGKFEVVSQEF